MDTRKDTFDRCVMVKDLYSLALTHRHSAVSELAMELHFDMLENPFLPAILVQRRYTELQALIATCRRYDRDQARRRRRAEWWWALRLFAMCAVVAGVTAIAGVITAVTS